MFAYIEGTLVENTASEAIVDAQGMGYLIYIPASALRHLPQLGKKIKFYLSFVIREFSHSLYGFLSRQERDLFEALMEVSGIGPRIALSLIGHLSPQDFHAAVIRNDILTITRVPGIGKKTAERLLIEMRDKLSVLLQTSPAESSMEIHQQAAGSKVRDALNALIHLGYTQNKAEMAIEKTLRESPQELELASLITQALKNIKSR